MPRRRSELVVISWRDIPAQVNARVGADKHQVVLPRRFQRAIDDAAMVAGKKTASEYVGEWRRTLDDKVDTDMIAIPQARRRGEHLRRGGRVELCDQFGERGA